jgi:hypothetical protein
MTLDYGGKIEISTLRTEEQMFSETSVTIYNNTGLHIPEVLSNTSENAKRLFNPENGGKYDSTKCQ